MPAPNPPKLGNPRPLPPGPVVTPSLAELAAGAAAAGTCAGLLGTAVALAAGVVDAGAPRTRWTV